MPAKAPIRILCVDDHAVLADCLVSRLELESDIECVGKLNSADALIPEVKRTGAELVLLDLEMPGPDPIEIMAEMKRTCPNVRTMILSAHTQDSNIDRAMQNGAHGYFSKADDPENIINAIRTIARGGTAMGEDIQERLGASSANGRSANGAMGSKLQSLTPREMEVLRMIGRGMARADIARTLHRSPKTIDAHHTSIMKKLDIHDRVQLTRYAIREGLVQV